MENIIGHKFAKQTLISNKSVQSWLICGPKGIGKATLAKSFANLVLTQDTSYTHHDHPDFLIIEDSTITVEKIRYLKNFLYLSPKCSDHKVVLIDSIEAANNNAKNAMLKILEEPTQNSIIIIISHKPYHVPATIKSRCFQLKLSPLSYDETKQVVLYNQKLCNEVFSLFCGLPGIIIDTAEKKIDDLYQCLLKILRGQSDFKTVGCIINTDVELDVIAYILQNLILRIVKSKIGIEKQSNEEFITKNTAYSISYWYEKHQQIVDLFISAEKFNLDKSHTLTNLINILN